MPQYKETADDLNKKYHQTFVLYDGKLAWMHHFEEAGSRTGEAIVSNIQREDGSKQTLTIEPTKIEPFQVNTMFVNNSELKDIPNPATAAVLVQRKPKRQWRRGICNENTQLRTPIAALYSSFGKQMPPWHSSIDFGLCRHILNPTYPTLLQGCKLINKYLAVAISQMFCITISSISRERYLLASHFGFIGECAPKHIWVHHPAALQEVRDFVSRTNQPIEVELVHA